MTKILLTILLVFPLLSTVAWAQYTQPSDTLTVEVLSPYSYKAEDGSTVVLGEIHNKNNFPVTGVKIGVSFYDDAGKILEYKTGTTLLKIIPAGGKIPFSISSTKPDQNITDISVNLTGLKPSPPKQQLLTITPDVLEISDKITLSGSITNSGTVLTTGTTIYLISYDAFGRVVGIASALSEPNDVGVGMTSNFNIHSIQPSNAKSYKLVADSEHYQSVLTEVTNTLTTNPLTKLVTITGTSVTDQAGNKYSTIPIGSPVLITSGIWIKYAVDQSMEQPYICYVQIKRVGGGVEFIGTAEGTFHGAEKQNATTTWTPQNDGAFFVEVYVWDNNAVALSSPSSMINVLLVK